MSNASTAALTAGIAVGIRYAAPKYYSLATTLDHSKERTAAWSVTL
jgi:hypothetical protein